MRSEISVTAAGKLGSKSVKNFLHVLFRFDLFKHLFDFALFVDKESRPLYAHVAAAHKLLLAVNSVSVCDLMIRIGQKGERKFVLSGKLLVRSLTVYGDAKYFDASLFKVRKRIAKRTGFFRASGRIVFGIKIENYFLAAKFLKPDSFIVRVFRGKVRRNTSFFKHGYLLFFLHGFLRDRGRTF